MKSIIKIIGIAVIAALAGLSITACGGEEEEKPYNVWQFEISTDDYKEVLADNQVTTLSMMATMTALLALPADDKQILFYQLDALESKEASPAYGVDATYAEVEAAANEYIPDISYGPVMTKESIVTMAMSSLNEHGNMLLGFDDRDGQGNLTGKTDIIYIQKK